MIAKVKRHWKESFIFFVSFIMLFMSFQFNTFSSADQEWFERHQFDSESFVIGGLVRSGKEGVFSSKGGLGRYYGLQGEISEIQTKLYLQEIRGGNFGAYSKQLGLQGIFFSLVDKFLEKYNLVKLENRINYFHAIASSLQAVVLAIIILLIYFEFGIIPSIVVLISIMFSQWLVVFGKNLYWVMGLMFIPMLLVWVSHKIEESKNKFYLKTTLVLVTLSILLKSSTGYEYISTILISMIVPVIYFSIKNAWSFKRFFKRSLMLGLAGVLGFVIAFSAHVYQTSVAYESTFTQALEKNLHHAASRMHAEEGSFGSGPWERATTASTFEVIKKYLHGKYFSQLKFKDLIFIFFLFSALGLISKEYSPSIVQNRKKVIALIAATWFSFLAPLSWYMLSKVHSYVHGHMNHVLWHMPFTIIGFALVGFIFYLLLKDLYKYKKYLIVNITGFVFLLFIGVSYIKYIVDSNKKVNNVLNDISKNSLLEIETNSGFKIFLTSKNKLIYYKPECKVSDIENTFFLHIFPTNQKDLEVKKRRFNGLDFKWDAFSIEIPIFSSYSGGCLAVKPLPNYPFSSFETGRYLGPKRFWQEYIDLKTHVKKINIITAYNLSDKNWKNGISKSKSAFILENNVINRFSIKQNDTLDFPYSGERKITKVIYSEKYINIYVNGSVLNLKEDGYPNIIKVIKREKK